MSKELENIDPLQLLEENKRLRSEIIQLHSDNDELHAQNNRLQSHAERMESKVGYLQFQIEQFQRMLFGAKRERFIPGEDDKQMRLPFDVQEQPEIEQEETITYTRKKSQRDHHPGRLKLPDHLPVEEIILEPEEDTTGMKCIGQEVTDQLELIPAKLFIKRFIRPRYITAVEDDDNATHKGVIADLPCFPIEKGIAGPGLLSQIMIDKFMDHLPIYRQIERFKRDGVKISSSTINGWQESVCHLLEPLYDALKHRVLSQGYLQVDETPIQVLDKGTKNNIFRGYHWVYYSPLEKTVLFDFREGRSARGPTILLKDFKGYLQTDGYKVYDRFGESDSITLLNCMAHARRGFEKALDYDKPKAEYAMNMFAKLYEVERKARELELTPEERHTLRLDESLPILNELGKWMAETYKTVLPNSAIGKATAYCIPRWNNLTNYLHDGSLEIDNNLAENAIRPIALGRKNYLFAGSIRGAERAAMFYSFFGTCKKNEVNPYQWLRKVLEIIPDYKANKLQDLLPQNHEL